MVAWCAAVFGDIADVAQLAEQPPRKWQVVGSNPTVGSNLSGPAPPPPRPPAFAPFRVSPRALAPAPAPLAGRAAPATAGTPLRRAGSAPPERPTPAREGRSRRP